MNVSLFIGIFRDLSFWGGGSDPVRSVLLPSFGTTEDAP